MGNLIQIEFRNGAVTRVSRINRPRTKCYRFELFVKVLIADRVHLGLDFYLGAITSRGFVDGYWRCPVHIDRFLIVQVDARMRGSLLTNFLVVAVDIRCDRARVGLFESIVTADSLFLKLLLRRHL